MYPPAGRSVFIAVKPAFFLDVSHETDEVSSGMDIILTMIFSHHFFTSWRNG